ncbi:SpoIIE family protein phosphatase [Streptomyces echinatus]|uniref:protein-serine/threonine phosphatase n=2 Tax=Streptomyces echinatus TaxID=67293 RepID=A0A7W9PQ57_9ACTN|nr:SpoIIE family protein phosphatase [Streptomyces echinatus]MBB5925805.1 serine phosphatase RsbU (regulator of sigma subunit)/PAS domain-containing protein/anti-sigma regulatory factor (Ser/Thr protein kinase) [Streptomyces echinatus]
MDRFPNAADVEFHSPLDLSRAAVAVLDAEGRVSGWGPSAQRLLGHAPEDVLGLPAERLLAAAPGQRPAALCRAGKPRGTVLDLCCRDGRILRAAVTFSPLAHRGAAATVVVAADLEALRGWELQLAMLQGLATESAVGLTIFDTDGIVVWGNVSTDLELAGMAQYIGKPASALFPEGEFISRHHPPDEDQIMEHVLTTGEPILGMHYRGRAPADPVREHVWSCSYHRLVDARGEPLGLFEESLDITDRYRAQERLSLLVRAGKRIGASLDVRRTAAELADVAVPQLADEVLVDLPAAVIEGRQPPTGSAPGHSLLRMHGRTSEEFRTSPVSYPPSSPQAQSLATSRPVVGASPPGTPDETETEAGASHSCLFVPLLTRDAVLGLATFRRSSNPDPFGAEEQTLAVELAERAAVGIDNARRYTSQHAAALVLQRSLLPQHLPRLSAVDVAYRYLPADSRVGVGGDWFDVIPLSGARVGLTVGDVVGHGMHAAATMGRLRATVRTLALLDLDPAELLTRLDDLVTQDSESRTDDVLSDQALGVTCLYAIYDPVSGRCVWASAGHPPPIVADANGAVALSALAPGPPLGLGGLPYENVELSLSNGSVVAFYTDGVVEDRRTDIDSGIDRLAQILAWQRGPVEELCDRALGALPPGPQADDATLLLVRTRRLDAGRVADLELPPDPAMVARARTLTERQLETWDLSDLSFTAALVVSELVTNGIRYTGGPVTLRLIKDRCLLCEVSDNAHTAPHLRRARRDDEGGRGLFLVAQVAQRWGTRYTSSGKTIWAELAIP